MKNSVKIVALQVLLMAVVISLAIDCIDDVLENPKNYMSRLIFFPGQITILNLMRSNRTRSLNAYRSPSWTVYSSGVIDVGPNWPDGVVWGHPGGSANPTVGNKAKPQADLAEFTIGVVGEDFYDLSNVNAYNLPLLINPTSIAYPGERQGLDCGTPICSIDNIYSFRQSPNYLTGPAGYGATTLMAQDRLPRLELNNSQTLVPMPTPTLKDDANHEYACPTGSYYEVVFYP